MFQNSHLHLHVWIVKPASEMTYIVSGGALNSTHLVAVKNAKKSDVKLVLRNTCKRLFCIPNLLSDLTKSCIVGIRCCLNTV